MRPPADHAAYYDVAGELLNPDKTRGYSMMGFLQKGLLDAMQYTEITPIPPLAAHVHCFWTLRAPASIAGSDADRILPDGHSEIIINRAAPFLEIRDNGSAVRQPPAIVAAQMTRFLLIRPTNEVDLVGIRFKPAGLHALIGAELHELVDRRIDLSCVNSKLERSLTAAALTDDDSLSRTQAVILSFLRMPRTAGRRELLAATEWIRQSGGGCRMEWIAGRIGMSGRQLERRFLKEVGVTPKRYARIVRFDALIRSAQSGACRNWTTLAHAHGFHDQPHLNREFRSLAGQTPTEYAKAENLISSLFTSGDDVSVFYNPTRHSAT